MCGRYALTLDGDALLDELGLDASAFPVPWQPSYNIAPTHDVPVLLRTQQGQHRLRLLRWGLIPSWAKDSRIGSRLINARAETVRGKPAFREAYQQRRCLVPASGFFEWRAEEHGKQPFWIHPPEAGLLTFAGLWDLWRDPDGDEVLSFTILTTRPSRWVAPLHDRMPVIVPTLERASWLAGVDSEGEEHGIAPEPWAGQLTAEPVSVLVNSPGNDDPECVRAVGPPLDPSDPFRGRPGIARQGDLFELN